MRKQEKPPTQPSQPERIVTKLRSLTAEERQSFLKGVTGERDNLQTILENARRLRMDLRFKSRVKYMDFLQKLGELSFTFGSAMVPLIIVTDAHKSLRYPGLVIAGAVVYLLNGMISFWQVKRNVEQDGEDSPFVGLDEEINTYPIIYAKDKLLLEPDNVDHYNEHINAQRAFFAFNRSVDKSEGKPTFWLDVMLFNFIAASLLVGGTIWPYPIWLYWEAMALSGILLISLFWVGYRRALKVQAKLRQKRETLRTIKENYTRWYNDKLGIPND